MPGHPEQNGAHERMHRTLEAETARPPESTMDRQQKRFDQFRRVYNEERPHEVLGQRRPATIDRPSPRPYPETLPPLEYAGPGEAQGREQRHDALEERHDLHQQDLTGEWVGLDEIDDGIGSVYYGPVLLARFDEREMRFYG